MPDPGPVIDQLNLAVRDMEATVAFYRRLGLRIDAAPGAEHVAVRLANGLSLELDAVSFVPQWDTGWSGTTGGGAVLGFKLDTREAVDERYADLTGAGYRGHQPPWDAFWGARYAIVDDPDGHPVGLMSPVDPARRSSPTPPPSAP